MYTQEILLCTHKRSLVYTQEILLCIHKRSLVSTQEISCAIQKRYKKISDVYARDLLCMHQRFSWVCTRDLLCMRNTVAGARDPKRALGRSQGLDRALFGSLAPARVLCMHKRSLVYTQEILLCIHKRSLVYTKKILSTQPQIEPHVRILFFLLLHFWDLEN